MNRKFTKSETTLLIFLAVILVGLLYYKFIFLTTADMIRESKAKAETLQTQVDLANTKLANLEKMESEVNDLIKTKQASKMESYNSSKEEVIFLHHVLADVPDYAINFSDVTRNGDQIRRIFSLQFKTDSYKNAEVIVNSLSNGQYRCLVDDISCSTAEDGIHVSLTATFFETMVGGTPDSALPPDEAQTETVDTTE
jgi:Tfp pilus assembly protein PilN